MLTQLAAITRCYTYITGSLLRLCYLPGSHVVNNMYLLSLYYDTLNLRDLLSVLLLCFTVFGFEGSDLLLSDCAKELHVASRRRI